MREALNQYEFLKNNLALVRDMRTLEELLVKAGLLTPEEVFDIKNEDLFENQMERASEIFYEITHNYYPELLAPMYD
jgi:hypothetical protein